MSLPDFDLSNVKGFLAEEEAVALAEAAAESVDLGPCLEVGSYCGLSAIHIGRAIHPKGGILFAVDHHRGSEENQPGWEWHDAELWDDAAGAMDTLPFLRSNLRLAGLEETVIPIVGKSPIIARYWQTPLGFLFIDGGHTLEHAFNDLRGWSGHVARRGVMAIHDVFPNPEDGGQAPFEIYKCAIASGLFEEIAAVESLRLLRRC